MRSLPPTSVLPPIRSYVVAKVFPVGSGPAAPAWGQVGGETQYLSPIPFDTLLKRVIIKEVLP
jgi:hypothetical protein